MTNDADSWNWMNAEFRRTRPIQIVDDDLFPEERYAKKSTVPLLPNGVGPFCTFKIEALPATSGVYVFFVDQTLAYVGRAQNLHRRFYQYGNISPKNCYRGGRTTNVAMNRRIRDFIRSGADVAVYIYETSSFKEFEKLMIEALQPPWNVAGVKKTKVWG